MKQYLSILLFSLLFINLHADKKLEGTNVYANFEIIDNNITTLGIGCREKQGANCFDWNVSLGKSYKYEDFKKFYPLFIGLNYLFFFPEEPCYIGLGSRLRLDINKNCFTPFEVNPCIILGFLTNIFDNYIFIELKSNFLTFIKLISKYKEINYSKKAREKALKNHYFCVNFGVYF